MYYHQLVSGVANAIRNADEDMLSKIEAKTRDLLLSEDEASAMLNLIEAAYQAIEAIGESS